MNQHDHRAQNREASEPEEGTRAVPKIVFVWIAILIVWGVGYYAWQIGKPILGGDSRTPVATAPQESRPVDVSTAGNSVKTDNIESPDSADAADAAADPSALSAENSDLATSTASVDPDGAAIFSAHCSACHQANGQGIAGAFPPLAGSEWVLADAGISVAIVHDGLQGKIEVAGNPYQGVMPRFDSQLSDAELAAVLSYVRSQWGNDASEISVATITEHKERFDDRNEWSAEELTEVFGKP